MLGKKRKAERERLARLREAERQAAEQKRYQPQEITVTPMDPRSTGTVVAELDRAGTCPPNCRPQFEDLTGCSADSRAREVVRLKRHPEGQEWMAMVEGASQDAMFACAGYSGLELLRSKAFQAFDECINAFVDRWNEHWVAVEANERYWAQRRAEERAEEARQHEELSHAWYHHNVINKGHD